MATTVNDSAISLRLKHGVHTILLFVDSLQPFSEISAALLDILRDRFPDGLTVSSASSAVTAVPEAGGDDNDEGPRIAYALPVNPNDLSQGWKDLRVGDDDTPVRKGLKDNWPVAFAFVPEGEEDEVEFVVDVPTFDEGYEEEEA